MAERKRQLIWSPEAKADLSEIWNYYAQAAGPGTADNFVRGIGEACRMLADHHVVEHAASQRRHLFGHGKTPV